MNRSWAKSSPINPSCSSLSDSTHLVQEVVIRGPVLLVEMSQDAVVPTGLAEVGWGQCVHRWLSFLG